MKYVKMLVLALFALGVGAFTVLAQSNPSYVRYEITVSSSSSPVVIIPPGYMSTWFIKPHATYSPCSAGVVIWPYVGSSTPTAVPTPGSPGTPGGVTELAAGQTASDIVSCDNNSCRNAIGQGWAVALASGSTACLVDSGYR